MFTPGGARSMPWFPLFGGRPQTATVPGITNDVRDFGARVDGVSDDTAAVNAGLAFLFGNGGGELVLPVGKCLCLGQIVIPNDGGNPANQPAMRIRGVAPWSSGRGTAPLGGSIWALRYSGANAKILTLGVGYLEIDHLTMLEDGSAATTTPFLLTTNTVVNLHHLWVHGFSSLSLTACVQDVFILGGTDFAAGNVVTSAFQGYGSQVWQCGTNRTRRFVYLRSSANSVEVRDNYIGQNCGTNLGSGAAIEIDGTSSNADGNIIANNLIEQTGYPYGCKVTVGTKNQFLNNAMWDEGGTCLAYYRFESGTLYNYVLHGHGKTSGIPIVSDANAAPSTNSLITNMLNATSYWAQPWTFAGNVMFGAFTAPQVPFGVSANTGAAMPTVIAGTIGTFVNVDGTGTALELMSFGAAVSNTFRGRVGGNTMAAPAATPNGSLLIVFGGFGTIDGTTWANAAQAQFFAAETWSSGHQGTAFTLQTTKIGTTARTSTFRVDGNFNVTVGPQAAKGTADTDGWPYMVSSAGAPTGVPATTFGAMVPYQYDTTNNKLWVYNGGWKGVVLS